MFRNLICLGILFTSFAFAHQPLWNEGSQTLETAFVIPEVKVSKAIFGELNAGYAYYQLDVPKNFPLSASLFVGGACNAAFLPEFWLLSPAESNNSSEAPFSVPEAYEVKQATGDWNAYSGHGLKGQKGPELRGLLNEGRYYLVVSAQNQGYYLVSLGGSEEFGGTQEGRNAIPKFNNCG